MAKLHPEALAQNAQLKNENPVLYTLFSSRGKQIFYPKLGIVAQTKEADSTSLNATVGEARTDDGMPMFLKAIRDAITLDPREVFTYAPTYGLASLRTAWNEHIKKQNPSLKTEYSMPIVTGGLTHALSLAGFLFVNTGDSIIIPELYWGNYALVYENWYGAKISTYKTFSNGGYNISGFADALAKGNGKKIVLLNFPNNPTGYTVTHKEAGALADCIRKQAETGDKIIIILDDAYFGFFYEANVFKESLFALLAGLHPNVLAIKIDGATKEQYAWGLRVGFVTYGICGGARKLYQILEDKTAGALRSNISNVSHLSQSLLLHGLSAKDYSADCAAAYQTLAGRYAKVKETLSNKKYTEYFTPLPYNSGYFMCVRLRDGISAQDVRTILRTKYDTGVVAITDLLRIAYSYVPTEKVPGIFENIYLACRDAENSRS